MIEQLKQENKVVGAKQTRRALKDHRAKRVYMAQDADPVFSSLWYRRRCASRCPWSR